MDSYFPADFYALRNQLREWCDATAPGGVMDTASSRAGGADQESADPSWQTL